MSYKTGIVEAGTSDSGRRSASFVVLGQLLVLQGVWRGR